MASTDVNMVSFTGSTQVGARIYADGAATMKRVLMELGGKGALVMTEDADVNAACMGIATTWGLHSGQICTALTRVICHRSILMSGIGRDRGKWGIEAYTEIQAVNWLS